MSRDESDNPQSNTPQSDNPESDRSESDVPDPEPDTDESVDAATPRRSPALIATIVAIPVMVVVLFIVFAAVKTKSSTGPLPLESISAPQSSNPDCARLIAGLPASFDGFGGRSTKDGLIEWAKGDDVAGPIQLRCGVDRPTELAPTSALQTVDPVQWFLRSQAPDEKGSLWFAVDHRPYVALWLPNNSGNGAISDVSAVIAKILPLAPIDLGP